LRGKISIRKNISANSLSFYTIYNLTNFINLVELGLEDSRRKLKTLQSSHFFDKVKYVLSSSILSKLYLNQLSPSLTGRTTEGRWVTLKDTKTLLDLVDIRTDLRKQTNISKNKLSFLGESLFLLRPNIFSLDYRKIDREIDGPDNKKSKGLVSYNKILFKKLLVFLKLLFNTEIELNLTRIKNPYNETHILNQILGQVIKYKSKNFYRLSQIIRKNANIKAKFISKLDQNTKNMKLSFILPKPLNLLNNLALVKENIILSPYDYLFRPKEIDNDYKIRQDQSLYDRFLFPIFVSKRKELIDKFKEVHTQLKPSANLDIERGLEIDIERERQTDTNISSYNCIVLDKWSNLNQFNKQKKIYKQIILDLKGIELDNQLFNNKEIFKEKDKKMERSNYKDRLIRDIIIEAKEEQQDTQINLTDWRNLRNNFSLIKGIKSVPVKDKLMKTTSQINKQKIKEILLLNPNESLSFKSANFPIDYYLSVNDTEKKKINKLMIYKMLVPLTNKINQKLMDLSKKNLLLYGTNLNKNTNNTNNKELNSM